MQDGAADDRFAFRPMAMLSGSIDGGGDADFLDYSAFTTGVKVKLTINKAANVLGLVHAIENVRRGSGGDLLIGDGMDNVLIGGGGRDQLSGGMGKDLLIGGRDGDILNGGADDDILIGGLTRHDNNDASLRAIMREWTRGIPYFDRIDHLRNGTGLNGPIKLNALTVFDDAASDTLSGTTGDDWFWATLTGPTRDRTDATRLEKVN